VVQAHGGACVVLLFLPSHCQVPNPTPSSSCLQVPLEKIFNKSLLDKFPWAMEVPSTWEF
jgi:hypothetical protein